MATTTPNGASTKLHHIVLLGQMAVGKTTVGRAVAEALAIPFIDSDTQISLRTSRSGRQIAADDGVAALHQLERDVLVAALAHPQRAVIAPAASVVDDPGCAAELEHHCCVWLRADQTVRDERRTGSDHRRGLRAGEIVDLARRDDVYEKLAGLVIDTGRRTVDEAVAAVVAHCRSDAAPDHR